MLGMAQMGVQTVIYPKPDTQFADDPRFPPAFEVTVLRDTVGDAMLRQYFAGAGIVIDENGAGDTVTLKNPYHYHPTEEMAQTPLVGGLYAEGEHNVMASSVSTYSLRACSTI
jgi:hypothetical protein